MNIAAAAWSNSDKNPNWFKRISWFYLPVSIVGRIICVLAAIFCFTVFLEVDRYSHSASDTFYGFFQFFICTFLMLNWIGSRTSGK